MAACYGGWVPLRRNPFSLAEHHDELVIWIWEQELEKADFFFLHKRRIKVGILDKMKEERRVKEMEGRAVCNVTSQILSQPHFMLRCSMGAILGMGSYGSL